MSFLPLLAAAAGWVLYSPVIRRSQTLAYENAQSRAWMGPQSFKLDSVAMRWSLPADSHSNYALGGGITFAIHRDFCARLIPLFPEQGYEAKLFGDFFLDCEDIRSAIARAMDTWAENHKNINFKDVSERCAHVLTTDYCPHAEIFIVPEHLEGTSTTSDLAAWVTHNLSETSITRSPTTTSGFEIPFNPSNAAATPGGIGVSQAKMTMRAPLQASTFCWYLDASFCSFFHKWNDVFDVALIGRLTAGILFGIAFIIMLWVIFGIVYAVCCETTPQSTNLMSADSVEILANTGVEMRSSSMRIPQRRSPPPSPPSPPSPLPSSASPPPSPPSGLPSAAVLPPPTCRTHAAFAPSAPSGVAVTPRTEAANHEVVLEQQPARGQRPGARPALNACGEPPQLSHKGEISRDQNDLACGSPRCTHLLDYLAVMPTGLLTFSLFWLIFCPAFYFRVFLPCWDCFDFEASIAHEVGHVLGFHHPDQLWELNLNANQSMRSCARENYLPADTCPTCTCASSPPPPSLRPPPPPSLRPPPPPPSLRPPPPPPPPNTCCYPWALDHVYLNQTRSIQSSIMFSLTTHKSRTCLSADDLEGLNYLYPVCSGAFDVSPEQPEPLCIKPKSLSGWLRLLYITFTPFVIITLLILSVQLCVRRHQKRKLRNLVETGERLRQQRTELIRKFKEAALKRAVSNAQNFRGNMLARAGTSRTLSGISARCSFGPQSPGRESQGASGRSLGGVNSHLGGGASSPAQHNREVEMERRRQQLAEVEEANLQAALAISRGEPPPMPTAGSLGFVGSRAFATSTEGLSIEEDGEGERRSTAEYESDHADDSERGESERGVRIKPIAPAEIEEANLQAALAASRVISVPARQVLGTRQQARFSEAGNSPEAHV